MAEEGEDDDDDDDDRDAEGGRMTEHEAMAAGAALGNLFKKEAAPGEKMKEHKALVFDCGTGETKAIFLQYKQVDGRDVVEMRELNKAPATLDFLHNKVAVEMEDYKKKVKEVETNKNKKGKTIFKDEESRQAAREALRDGYWFLDEKPAGCTGILEPQHFVDFCLQTKHKLEQDGCLPDTIMIGASAWARDAGSVQEKADQLVVDLTKAGLLCKKLLQTQEGCFEAAAVGYAYNAMLSKGPDDMHTPTGLIGSGGGSVQFMNQMQYPVNLDCGNRMCLDAMVETYDSSSPEAGLASLDACFEKAVSFSSKENASTQGLHGRVFGEIIEERGRTLKAFAGDKDAQVAIKSKLGGHVIAISACYYGAVSIGRANLKDEDMTEYPAGQIIAEMKAKIEEDKKVLREGVHTDKGKRETLFKEIANLTLQITLFSELLADDCMLCFKRNWTLNGVPFRTTWTAGWYLNFLYSVGIHFPGADPILAAYAQTQQAAQKLLGEAGDRLGGAGNEDVAMVLVDMKTVIKGMRAVALQIGNPIDKFLKNLADEFGGQMLGWPKFKIKGNGSLYRKLVGTIFELLEKNADVPSYTPNIEECVSSIHDCLRYTLIFEPDRYKEAVIALEKSLLTGPGHKAKSIKFKNFWREEDGETCYQGINAQVCLNPVMDLPKDEAPVDTSPDIDEGEGDVYHIPECTGEVIPNSNNFIFELQLHTPQSFAMKDGPGHLLYEDFRDPAVRKGSVMGVEYDGTEDKEVYNEFKKQLYLVNKKLFLSKDENGKPLKEGDPVCKGLKTTKHHKWTDDDYTYKPFKPEPNIAFYQSGIPGARWVNALQVAKKIERQITGLEYPFGYRIAKTEAEHQRYLDALKAKAAASGGSK